ncbi:hypothetical protein LCGC14_0964420 [marine sediment metagenome]|uniref:Uncharacterized protein n=1 Tax=marine sediment metagenome TaxID=412755 RepID=A0A0F9QWQ0_9ZZZZ
MTDEQTADEEQPDLIAQFLSDADASAEDKRTLDGILHTSTTLVDPPILTRLRRLVLMLADWCYDEGYDDGEAGRQ